MKRISRILGASAFFALGFASLVQASDGENNRLPEFLHLTKTGLASSWDGRLIFDARGVWCSDDGVQVAKHKWVVSVFRPENVGTSGDPFTDLQQPSLFSSEADFDWDTGCPLGASPSNADGRLHLAAYPDPAFDSNPFRSDATGFANPAGAYETYRIKIVGRYKNILSSNVPASEQDEKVLGRTDVKIVVGNPRTGGAFIQDAVTLSPARLLKAGSAVLHGYEPTMSMDGRLLIWHGHPDNEADKIRFVMYSFNPDPHTANGQPPSVDDTGWSQPDSISAMYSTHGPGALSETLLPNGVLFSDQYPIARQPLSMFSLQGGVPQVSEVAAETPFPGAYPWLSWDASELMFPIVPNFRAATRNAFSVIGARTNWILEHVDGPVNWTRGNVTDSIINWPHQEPGATLLAAYEQLTLDLHQDPMSMANARDYETILLAPLALGHSMWSPSPGDPTVSVPYFAGRDTYSFVASHSGRYFEVPLFRERDGRFIASFPFNEALALNAAKAQLLEQTDRHTQSQLHYELARDVVTYQGSYTSDISGNGIIGTLQAGAQFPYDYHEAKDAWQTSQDMKDYTEGLKGNSVYFRPGSYVDATLPTDLLTSMAGKSGWSISMWLNPVVDLTTSNFSFMNLGNDLLYMGKWGTHLRLGIRDESSSALLADVLLVPASQVFAAGIGWRHLAISYHQRQLSVYLDGALQKTETLGEAAARHLEAALSDGNARALKIGPSSLNHPEIKAVLMIDEFDLLNAALDQRTLSRLSFTDYPVVTTTTAMKELGRQLFFDTRLSANQTISCATCHRTNRSFADSQATSAGVYGRSGSRNVPALIGTAAQHSKMLTASVPNAEAQWALPLSSENEMGVPVEAVVARLNLDPNLVQDMQTTFGSGPSAENIGKALAAYVRSISAAADVDHHTVADHPGRALFFGKARCSNCHNGPTLSDGNLHNIGLTGDAGRFADTGLATDQGKFKTAPLVGLKHSGPYFHDGSESVLEDVVAEYNLGFVTNPERSYDIRPLNLSPVEVDDLTQFLRDLPTTGAKSIGATVVNLVTNLQVDGGAGQGFSMVIGGVVPSTVTVEVRNVGTGSVLTTLNPSYTVASKTTILTGSFSGSVLTAFRKKGVLLNIRYVNSTGRVVLSGPRFIKSDPGWPGAPNTPVITAAAPSCVPKECISIDSSNLSEFTVIELSDPVDGMVVALHSSRSHKIWGYEEAFINVGKGSMILSVDPQLWPIFATSGLQVRLINRHGSNNPSYQSSPVIVTSPTLVWQ